MQALQRLLSGHVRGTMCLWQYGDSNLVVLQLIPGGRAFHVSSSSSVGSNPKYGVLIEN